jgi:hypothetical protein
VGVVGVALQLQTALLPVVVVALVALGLVRDLP